MVRSLAPHRPLDPTACRANFFVYILAGPEEGQGPAAVVEAGQVRWWQAKEEEVEQGKAKGEGKQRGAVRPGYLRQAALGGAQVQANHPFHPLRASEDQRLPCSEGHQGLDGAWPHSDGLGPLKPADLHQGNQYIRMGKRSKMHCLPSLQEELVFRTVAIFVKSCQCYVTGDEFQVTATF
ncbi:ribosomal protein S25 [Zea mays]|uniref:Ribosomal protein S25 n=1 Tax=Zea mays TaxID=4577 RepID=A0A1D6PYT8_MAIZE|nr:ribosomal protein S25 [Zea mays]